MRKSKSFLAAFLACAMLTSTFAVSASATEVETADSEAVVDIAASAADAATFSWDNATVYFLLTDRFNNGNTSNDNSYNRGSVSLSDDRATFHGGDFAGITEKIEEGYFNDLGVNAIWLSAPYEQIHGYIVGGDGSPSFAHYSYHGYYVLDYTQTDKNFGTEEEFRELVDTAHEHGIRIVMDVVLNHAGYNSLYDMNEYGFGAVKDGWESYYNNGSNVNNKDYHSYIDYEASADLWGKWWGTDWIRAGLPGYTEGGGDNYTSSLAGLPDFMTESTKTVDIPPLLQTKWTQEGTYAEKSSEVKNYLSSKGKNMTVTNCISYWLSSWVREYGVDGFRCDTAKHVEYSSWKTLKDMCVEALDEWKAENPDKALDDLDFWMTGECWDHGVSYDDYYKVGGFDSMINFDTTGGGVLAKGTVGQKYDDYAGAINNTEGFNVLSYMSSHDSTLARGNMYELGSALLLLPGGVQIYYGDETNRPLVSGIPFDGNGGAGHSLRSDMNWDDYDEELLAHWQVVGQFRNRHIAVGAGDNTSATVSSGVGFTRSYNKNGVKDKVAGVIYATANKDVTIDVSSVWEDGQVVVNAYDSTTATVEGGEVTFNSGAHGTILIEEPDGTALITLTGNSSFEGTQEVTINIKDADSAKVSVDGGKKFMAYDGDTFTIGETAYPGDTVKVSVEATNEKGTVTRTFSFKKIDPNDSGDSDSDDEQSVTIYLKPYGSTVPNLYVWDDKETSINGAWPGTAPTEKTDDGWYVFKAEGYETINAIVNIGGDSNKSEDITGLSGEVYIEMTGDSCSSYKKTTPEPVVSGMDLLKSLCRTVKNMTSTEYTSATYTPLYDTVLEADKIIAKGDAASDDDINAMISDVEGLMAELVLASPVVTSMDIGATTVKGTAACGADVKVSVGGKEYTTVADDITGVWSVDVSKISAGDKATISASNSVAASKAVTVTVGDIDVVDKTELASKIAEAKKYTSGDYKQSAIDELLDAIDDASDVYDDSSATQSEVDAQVKALEAAIENVKNNPLDDTDSETESDTESETDIDSDSETDSDSDTESDTDIPTDTDSDTYSDTDSEPNIRMGDVNFDGKVSLRDASILQQYVAHITDLTNEQKAVADITGDGKITLKDATGVQVFVAENA